MHTFSKNLDATLKFLQPKWWHEVRPMPRIHKYWATPCKILSLWRHETGNLCISVLLQQQLSFQDTFPTKFQVIFYCYINGDTQWRSWLRRCTTSRNVAGSIPDSFFQIFHWHNPSGHTMALGLTQSLTEMSTRDISWGVKADGRPARRTDNLNTSMCQLPWNLTASNSWNPQGLFFFTT